MDTTTRTHARHICFRRVIPATLTLVALALATAAWLPSGRPDTTVAEPQRLTAIAATTSGSANLQWSGNHAARRLRTEAPVFVLSGGRFTAFDAPEGGSNHFPRINNRGDVVGEYFKADGSAGGFLRDPRGRFTEIAYPSSVETIPTDINDRQDIVGSYLLAPDGPLLGFRRDRRGRFSTIQVPDAVATQALGINNRSDIVGDYTNADGTTHGYLWHNGRFTTIDGPDGTGATLTEINDRGQILGVYSTQPGTLSGFLLDRGRYTTIDAPDAPYTVPLGINARGHIVGSTFDALEGATTEAHGFLLRDGADGPFTPIDIPGAIIGTNATGINDRGQIVGRYGNPNVTADRPAPDMMPTDTESPIAQATDRPDVPTPIA